MLRIYISKHVVSSHSALRLKISKNYKIFENCVFQAYVVENIKLVAGERRSLNIVPEMVLFPEIYMKIHYVLFSFDL